MKVVESFYMGGYGLDGLDGTKVIGLLKDSCDEKMWMNHYLATDISPGMPRPFILKVYEFDDKTLLPGSSCMVYLINHNDPDAPWGGRLYREGEPVRNDK